MNPKKKETRRIFQEIFKPSCYGNNSQKMLDCCRIHFMKLGKEDCRWYMRCLDLNFKKMEQGLRQYIDSRPDLKRKYPRVNFAKQAKRDMKLMEER